MRRTCGVDGIGQGDRRSLVGEQVDEALRREANTEDVEGLEEGTAARRPSCQLTPSLMAVGERRSPTNRNRRGGTVSSLRQGDVGEGAEGDGLLPGKQAADADVSLAVEELEWHTTGAVADAELFGYRRDLAAEVADLIREHRGRLQELVDRLLRE